MQSGIAVLLIVSMPLWKKSSSAEEAEEEKGVNLTLFQMAKKSEIRLVWLIMLVTNARKNIP